MRADPIAGSRGRSAPGLALALLLAAHAGLALSYLRMVPVWEAPDEPAHYLRIRELGCRWGLDDPWACAPRRIMGDAGRWRLHVGEAEPDARCTPADEEDPSPWADGVWARRSILTSYQSFQPPLGHLIYVPWFLLVGPTNPPVFLHPQYPGGGPPVFVHEQDRDPVMAGTVGALRALRLPGVAMGLLTLVAIWLGGRVLAPDRPGVAVASVALAAFLPQFTFTAGYLNNDMLAAAAGAWLALWILRGLQGPVASRAGWLAGVWLLLATAVGARLNALGLVVWVVAALTLRVARRRGTAGVLMILGGGLATLGAAGILARQIAPGMLDDLGHQASARLRWGNEMGILEAVRRLGRSFVGEFGWLDVRLPVAAYWVATALGLGLLGAVAARLVSVRRSRQGTMMGVLLVGALVVAATALLNAGATGQAQGRYLFPALGGLALLGGWALFDVAPARAGLRGAALLAALLFAGNVAVLVGVIRPSYADATTGFLTLSDPLLIRHGLVPADESPETGLPPDPLERWLLAAPDGEPVSVQLGISLVNDVRLDLLGDAIASARRDDPAELPGIRRVETTGTGAPADRVQPVWMPDGTGSERQVLAAHPASRIHLEPVRVPPGARLQATLALHRNAWDAGGDGVTYRVLARRAPDQEPIELLDRHVERAWVQAGADLSVFAGEDLHLVLETLPGPAGDDRFDWAGWTDVRIVTDWEPAPVRICAEEEAAPLDPRRLALELPPGGVWTLQLLPAPSLPAGTRFRLLLEPREPIALADSPAVWRRLDLFARLTVPPDRQPSPGGRQHQGG